MSNLKVAVVEDLTTADTVPTKYLVHGSAKAWSQVSATLDGIDASFNISSITDGGTGNVTLTLTASFASSAYSLVGSATTGAVGFANVTVGRAAGSYTGLIQNNSGTTLDRQTMHTAHGDLA